MLVMFTGCQVIVVGGTEVDSGGRTVTLPYFRQLAPEMLESENYRGH